MSPVASMAAAACLVIPLGSRAGSLARALLRGAALGALAGAGICGALAFGRNVAPQQLTRLAAVYVGATAGMCAAVAALFFHLAGRRKQLIDDDWRR